MNIIIIFSLGLIVYMCLLPQSQYGGNNGNNGNNGNGYVYADKRIHSLILSKLGGYKPVIINNHLRLLNNYKLDFIIDSELNTINATKYKNIRAICSLYRQSLVFLSPNDSNILDIGDIKHYSCKVNIALSREQLPIIKRILHFYDKDILDNIKFKIVDNKSLIDNYGSLYKIYAEMIVSDSPNLLQLTNKVPSHLVTINKINSGSYYKTISEQPFYKKYPYYHKSMIEIKDLAKSYPRLTSIRDLYYPSIYTKYIILCHDKTSDDKVSHIMKYVLSEIGKNKLYDNITVTDISYITAKIEFHREAMKIFRELQLHDVSGTSIYAKSSPSLYSGSASPS